MDIKCILCNNYKEVYREQFSKYYTCYSCGVDFTDRDIEIYKESEELTGYVVVDVGRVSDED